MIVSATILSTLAVESRMRSGVKARTDLFSKSQIILPFMGKLSLANSSAARHKQR
jgi:hypothetical protein